MAIQTYTTGQVLTAAQMTTLQTNDYNQTVSAKTASYTLVAADVGTRITMSNASATTVTVNTALFEAGDTLTITNIGAGVCTVTAGTATVSTSSTLALKQFDSGQLYFTSTGVAIFFMADAADASGGGKVLQVVAATTTTVATNATSTFADTNLTATITPTLNTSKILVLVNQNGCSKNVDNANNALHIQVLRGATQIALAVNVGQTTTTLRFDGMSVGFSILDAPATTSATTYKTQFKNDVNVATVQVQQFSCTSTIVLLEIGA